MSEDIKSSIKAQEEFYQKKKKENHKSAFSKGLKIICILIILTAVGMIAERSIVFIRKANMFNINNLIVNGNIALSFNDIIEILDIKSGDNIFYIKINELKNKLELHPRVKSVSVKRELPCNIIINVVERESIALLNVKKDINHCLYEIDEEGYVISEDPFIVNYDLPVITGDFFNKVIPGDRLNNKHFLNVLKTLSSIEKKYYNYKRLIAELNIKKDIKKISILMYLNHFNVKVEFGEDFNIEKLNKLNSLLMVVGDNIYNLEYIDFRYNEAVGKYKI